MNSEKNKTSGPHRLVLKKDKKGLKSSDKYIRLSNLSIYYTWKNINKLHENNGFKISAPTCNDKFTLHDGSYSVTDIEDSFEYMIKKPEI